ncbi:unnamed protein product [Protopolystoma xenopodis]|uniref:Uncharacterized protein n=1 Tax=Protopolystoma xenopodis TaxID=117903 RepID=A0A3S5AK43_9PLAT|nr:unnamed protein product [Protopolystoma xenopodis]
MQDERSPTCIHGICISLYFIYFGRICGISKTTCYSILCSFVLHYRLSINSLERLVSKARGVLDVFEPLMGRIEIKGLSGRIERVYFEIKQQHIDQWEAPQIKESKRTFLHAAVGETDDKEKLEIFVNFCEDTIFEMQHAQEISGDAETLSITRVS